MSGLVFHTGDLFTHGNKNYRIIRTTPKLFIEEYEGEFDINTRKVKKYTSFKDFMQKNTGAMYVGSTDLPHIGAVYVEDVTASKFERLNGFWMSTVSFLNEMSVSLDQPKEYQKFLMSSLMDMASKFNDILSE